MAVGMLSMYGTSRVTSRHDGGIDPTEPQDAAEPTAKVESDPQALEEFLREYRLAPGQNLKRVPPPRPDGVHAWWKKTHPRFANQPHQFGAMTFRWSDPDRLISWSMTTADQGYTLSDLLRYLELNIYPTEIDGDLELLKTPVSGDWIYREGIPVERMVAALESILQRVLRLRITMRFRQVERDVVVARGQYRHSPLPGRSKNQIEIYGKQIVPGGGGAGGGTVRHQKREAGLVTGR